MPRPVRVRYARIARLVDDLIAKHRVTRPPVDVRKIARSEGFRISYEELDDDLSGFLLKGSKQFVIGVNSSNAVTRQRFTIAHECGHAFLHDFDDLHIDFIKLRSSLSSKAVDVEEIEANTFAASLLMPEQLLTKDLLEWGGDVHSDESLAQLADAYGVSQQSMSFRIGNLVSRSPSLRHLVG